jgi:hypothetical protein
MRKFVVLVIGGIVLLLAAWGTAKHAVKDAQLEKDYQAQKDSTQAWKTAYKSVEDARKNLHDTLTILDNLNRVSSAEAQKWKDIATISKTRLVQILRPPESDSTNPKWMHRSKQLEIIVAAQDTELILKDKQLQVDSTKIKLLLSQMTKDSVALYSANGNIDRLNTLVESYRAKSNCKVLWLLPCLSRTQSAVVGGIAGAATVVLVNTRRKK